jgi:UDP-N-acetylmuramoyl-L-alanyl-D-glutamate--2,6-diaminopimelate ligase
VIPGAAGPAHVMPMTLDQLAAAIPGARRAAGPVEDRNPLIARVAPRSSDAGPDAVFVCVPGVTADGHDFAPDAAVHGAAALVVERVLPLDLPQVVVDDARLAIALIAAELAGRPGESVRVVGVTGTNGKTTSAYLLQAVLGAAGATAGLLSTVEVVVGGRVEPATHTTPDPVMLQGLLARMRDAGDWACAMEVSSHALVQRRVAGIPFAAAIFTNLSQDHLDYHEDMESYFLAKRLLFERPAADGPNPPGAANTDDAYGARLVDELGILGFGTGARAEVRPTRVRQTPTGIRAEIATPRGPVEIASRLRGDFNVLNLLGVVAAGELLAIPHRQVVDGIAALPGVPGRLEPIDEGQDFQVLVDYAHTPDALANVLRTARGLAGTGRVIVVFGCGGDRDRGKRPLMGYIAAHLADDVVVTSDNPRSEDPGTIIGEIVVDAGGERGRLRVEPDRRAAIVAAIGGAHAGDVVVIAGKGHERGQEIAGRVLPFDDRDVAREVLRGQAG